MNPFHRSVFIDTSAYFAIANSADQYHSAALSTWQRLVGARRSLVTSDRVVAELHALLARTFGQPMALDVIDRLARGATFVMRVSEQDEADAWDLLRHHLDKRYTLVDAMSLVLMQRHGFSQVFTFDRHFVQHGFRVLGLEE